MSEAINSMYKWYQNAVICYAYLADLNGNDRDNLGKCKWFFRGWTLQELIAPRKVMFYGKRWSEIGTKEEMRTEISKITCIDEDILVWSGDLPPQLQHFSIATRMSWASHRSTTRVEDIAYCLLGIFDVNMPLLYGEGQKAFTRLQEEIIKGSDDHSLFAWWPKWNSGPPEEYIARYTYLDMLASSPAMFAGSRNVLMFNPNEPAPFIMTNRGLMIDLPIGTVDNHVVALLYCYMRDDLNHFLAIRIKKPHKWDREATHYVRFHSGGGPILIPRAKRSEFQVETVYIANQSSILNMNSAKHTSRSGHLFIPQSKDYTMLDAVGEIGYKSGMHLDRDRQIVFLNMKEDSSLSVYFKLTEGAYNIVRLERGHDIVLRLCLEVDRAIFPIPPNVVTGVLVGPFRSQQDAEQADGVEWSIASPHLKFTAHVDDNALESTDVEIVAEVKKEDVMGQMMWVATLQLNAPTS